MKLEQFKTNLIGCAYLFNLIVGCGSLMLPLLFWMTGFALGTIIVFVLAFFSFVSATFVFESLSICNGLHHKKICSILQSETAPLMNKPSNFQPSDNKNDCQFEIKLKYELVEMINMSSNKGLLYFFLIVIVGYLYADLCIFYIVVGNSLESVICSFNNTQKIHQFCINVGSLNSFRLFTVLYVVIVCSLVFFDLRGTKPVQIITGIIRWTSMLLMISLSISRIVRFHDSPVYDVSAFNLNFASYFIGAALYSFMCHHSLPSVVSIGNRGNNQNSSKMNYSLVLGLSLFASLLVYLLLSLTAVFAFKGSNIQSVFTLNFASDDSNSLKVFVAYFLALYPILALASSIPTIGITLRENILSFCLDFFAKFSLKHKGLQNTRVYRTKWFLRRILLPVLVIFPPLIIVTFVSRNLKFITSITGNYFGAAIQYVLPSLLVRSCRIKAIEVFGDNYDHLVRRTNGYQSPFKHFIWYWMVLAWSCACFVIITIQTVISFKF